MAETNAVGWRGYCKIGNSVLPYISSTLSETQSLYRSETIHGGGVGTIDGKYHSEQNYALGRVLVQGDISSEIFGGTGSYATAFKELLKRAIGDATTDTRLRIAGFSNATEKLIFSPGGGFELVMPDAAFANGKAVISRMALRGNPDGNAQFDATIISAGCTRNQPATLAPSFDADNFLGALEPPCPPGQTGPIDTNYNPIPYYATAFTISDCSGETSMADRVTDWSIEVNNNSNPIYTFNGSPYPVDIVQGIMEVTGTFSYYSPNGDFARFLTHGATLSIRIGTNLFLRCPHIGFDVAPIPAPGMNQPVVRNVTFRCFAQNAGSAVGDSLHIATGAW
jgi:hypothetical protein